ncbi:MAG: YjbQ family protein [Nitrospiraceae bacterium]|nr:MAG: YjbQ family protein [Nitrospiraceae bacterium]
MLKSFGVKTRERNEFIDITSQVQEIVDASGVKNGICNVYVPHTTAAVTINEGADPSVVRDIQNSLNKLVPHRGNYLHMEGNSDAHIKTSLVGSSETVIIEKGKLQLGTWQSIFFCEFDGSRHRRVTVKIISDGME